MNFDDTARYFGPSEKLWPELFLKTRKTVRKALSVGQWKYAPQAWWPELPGKDDRSVEGARLCPDCRRVSLNPRQRVCAKCGRKRRTKSVTLSRRAKMLTVKPVLP